MGDIMEVKIPFTDNSAHCETDFCTLRRLKETIDFIEPKDMKGFILDVGEPNFVAEKISQHFHRAITPTQGGDFNNCIVPARRIHQHHFFNTVLCLEVIEHVMNPLNVVCDLRELMYKGGVLYLSTPVRNPLAFWFNRSCHFTEYDVDKMCTMLEYAGFEVCKVHTFRSIPIWEGYKSAFPGLFRTTLRIFSQRTMLIRCVKK